MALAHASLRTLHYLSPFLLLTFSIASSVAAGCFLPPSKRTKLTKAQQSTSKWFAIGIATLYGFEGLTCLGDLLYRQTRIGQDVAVYVTLSMLIWITISLILQDSVTVYRATNVASWLLTAFLEVAVTISFAQACLRNGLTGQLLLAVKLSRILAICSLCGSLFIRSMLPTDSDLEQSPLLGQAQSHSAPSKATNYGGLSQPIAVGESERTKERGRIHDEHHQQLEALGGRWGYLKQYQIFLPYIIPTKNRRLQVYAICIVSLLLCERALNLIGPVLIGDLVTKTNDLKGGGQVPWREICLLIFAVKLPQDLIVSPLQSSLKTRIHFWSYKELLLASFTHVMSLSLEFHENKNTAEVSAAAEQAQTMNRLLDCVFFDALPVILDYALIFGYLSYVFDLYMGLIIATLCVIYVAVTYKCTTHIGPRRRLYLQSLTEQKRVQFESFSNWQSAAYFNRQGYHRERLQNVTNQEIKDMARSQDLGLIQHGMQDVVMALGYGAALFLATYQVIYNDRSVGTIPMLIMYWWQLTRPIGQLAGTFTLLVDYVVDAERLLQIMQKQPTVLDCVAAQSLKFKGGKIDFQDVDFSYDSRRQLIQRLNFTVEPGQTVAFVGQTGSGKTTICNKLLFRFYDVLGGSILIDGQDVRNVTQSSLREMIGIVPQDPGFMNTTILEAVRYARLEARDDEVYEACKAAAIHDKILTFPDGYLSKIGERGVKLSGGERQRFAIAQLFLRNPRIVVLDEATSTVDNVTETEIQNSLGRICKDRTTVIIAHRLSTVMHADQIFVLDRGQIIERGTHDELLGRGGKYWQLWAKKKTHDMLVQKLEHLIHSTDDDEGLSPITPDLLDLSDEISADSSMEDFTQLDGQGESKRMQGSNPSRTRLKRKMHDWKQRFGKRVEQEEEYEVDEDADDSAPMHLVSPRPTTSTIAEAPRRLSSVFKRKRESQDKKRSVSAGRPSRSTDHEQGPADPTAIAEERAPLVPATSSRHLQEGSIMSTDTVIRHPTPPQHTANDSEIYDEDDIDGPSTYDTPAASMRTPSTNEGH
ncbi:hypothetical protein BDV96DRAFT_602847 [Lophiotrema nucula]|uniref:P-loop containing nucleoside triphosphate hydrolase protein n=1 Tax=Lophiotrema nucula TaxID=690887 RepID=A0A6A5YY27_9PLEO|nr:hypothetical protein BDV96DRAFT_602847 [Lophiotrema nucula]